MRLLDLDPEAAMPASSNAAVSKLFDDVRGNATTIPIDDAADALASSTLLDEVLHGRVPVLRARAPDDAKGAVAHHLLQVVVQQQ